MSLSIGQQAASDCARTSNSAHAATRHSLYSGVHTHNHIDEFRDAAALRRGEKFGETALIDGMSSERL